MTTTPTASQRAKAKRARKRTAKKAQSGSRRLKQNLLDEVIRLNWRDSDREIARRENASPTTVGKRRKALEKRGEILPTITNGHSLQACLFGNRQ